MTLTLVGGSSQPGHPGPNRLERARPGNLLATDILVRYVRRCLPVPLRLESPAGGRTSRGYTLPVYNPHL